MLDPGDDDALMAWFGELEEWDHAQPGAQLFATLAYGADPEQVIDHWGPSPEAGGKALVALHGGYFLEPFGRALQNPFARGCAAHGLSVFNAEYRRHGCGGDLERTTSDVRHAVDFLAERFALTRVAVIGHSAGGYLAQTLADHPMVDLVVALGSVSDLEAAARSGQDDGAIAAWLGAEPEENCAIYTAGDLLVSRTRRAPQLLIHGDRDGVVDISQSRNFVNRATHLGVVARLIELRDEGHFAFLDPRETAFGAAIRPVLEWWRS